MFALVDVNNMYVSCERVFRPSRAPWGAGTETGAFARGLGARLALRNDVTRAIRAAFETEKLRCPHSARSNAASPQSSARPDSGLARSSV